MLTLPSLAATAHVSKKSAAARSLSPRRSCASADKQSAVARHGLHGGSSATARLASVAICSAPAAHMAARNMARADSNDAVPSTGIESNAAVSSNAAHRCASAVWPVNTAIHPASTASGGYSSTAAVAEGGEPPLHG